MVKQSHSLLRDAMSMRPLLRHKQPSAALNLFFAVKLQTLSAIACCCPSLISAGPLSGIPLPFG